MERIIQLLFKIQKCRKLSKGMIKKLYWNIAKKRKVIYNNELRKNTRSRKMLNNNEENKQKTKETNKSSEYRSFKQIVNAFYAE